MAFSLARFGHSEKVLRIAVKIFERITMFFWSFRLTGNTPNLLMFLATYKIRELFWKMQELFWKIRELFWKMQELFWKIKGRLGCR
jgi:hypothetical protein